ncbi:MAG TPA: nickel-dependent hydrogenase large subunit [Desulfovibrio sp.]|jgi:coenzyme F420-reducing hydrogenase alpha subunit|uniref:Ni/Fe hydrogenase subunit alpha n=1 Tax=Desulfovibrio TaxID=872 RepID=UPI000412C58B|nr:MULTISPECIES: nickel-dependent hydrogenase large subunit [Desulfovibrio]MDY0306934.1 nickel-dependent hydrogenase large subunit [Desulfovibrionaceae bacterium]HMM37346.1 nickel-dependent hydrogenase large subunit [Desulfovibrio sp.]
MAKKTQQSAAPGGAGKRVDVHYLTRVEGHGNIVVEIEADGRVSACRWEVPEAPRFFEAMLIGRDYRDVHHITSRICGICSIGHQLASLQATEDALDIRVSEQTLLLRRLAVHGENLQSHLLHIAYLVLPDLLGVDSVIPLAETHKDALLKLVAARRMSNEFCRIICGRTTHPQRMTPGGWMKIPTVQDLMTLRTLLVESLPNLDFAVDLVASLADKIPAFERKTEYIALVSPTDYALYWGEVGSSQDERHPVRDYKSVTREYCVPQSTAKWSKNVDESYMVGALARFNLNAAKLTPGATAAAAKLGLKQGCANPFMNTVAQLVECVHSVEDSVALIDKLLARGPREEALPPIRVKAGKGAGAVEVPRGILFHAYEYDANGRVFQADCVIPTNQNHANIQKDMEALVPTLADKSEAEIELILSMLVRAYDPCISCSTHTLDLRPGQEKKLVRFVRK